MSTQERYAERRIVAKHTDRVPRKAAIVYKMCIRDRDSLSLSPNGNGGWFYSMSVTGILDDVHQRGIEWLNIFAVDKMCIRDSTWCDQRRNPDYL